MLHVYVEKLKGRNTRWLRTNKTGFQYWQSRGMISSLDLRAQFYEINTVRIVDGCHQVIHIMARKYA